MNDIIVYARVAIRNVVSNAVNASIKNTANIKLATAIGFLSNFSSTIEKIITAIEGVEECTTRNQAGIGNLGVEIEFFKLQETDKQ